MLLEIEIIMSPDAGPGYYCRSRYSSSPETDHEFRPMPVPERTGKARQAGQAGKGLPCCFSDLSFPEVLETDLGIG